MPASGKKQQRPADKIQDLNARLTKLAQGNDQVTIVDTYKLFAGDDGDAKLEEFPDLLHPNDIGYEKWAAALKPVFEQLGLTQARQN
jgi:beta-glucosidase